MVLPRRLAIQITLALTIAALLLSGYQLARLLLMQWSGGFDGIAYIFFTVSRGIQNGLRPYADLYDSKPPGMYLVTLLSLLVTGNHRLAMAQQIVLFLLLPVLPAVFAYRETQGKPKNERFLVTGLGWLLGTLLFFFLEGRTGGYMAESFGACIGCLYLFHLIVRRDPSKPSAFILNTLLLAGTYGFKEPFLLTMTAGALLLARDTKHFRTAFLWPMLASLVTGTAVLALLGWLSPYLSYVENMAGARILFGRGEALWMRGFTIARVMGNMMKGYGTPVFGLLIGSLLVFAPAFRVPQDDRRTLARITLASIAVLGFILAAGIAIIGKPDYPLLLPASVSLPLSATIVRLAAGAACVGLAALLFALRPSVTIIRAPLALMLTGMAVGIAEYQPTHFGFAIPFLFALVLLFLRYAAQGSMTRIPVLIIGGLTILTALSFCPTESHLRFLEGNIASSRLVDPAVAARFDAMMGSCNLTKYFSDDVRLEFALSRISPMGPLFVVGEHSWYLAPDAPLITDTIKNIRDNAEVFVMHTNAAWKMNNSEWGAQWGNMFTFFPELEPLFTVDAPACAREFLPFTNMKVLFRKP